MRSLGITLVLGSLWTSTILADTGLYFPQHNVRLRRSPDKLAGYGAPAEDTGADYSYDEEVETEAASQPGEGYLAPEEETTAEADTDYNEEPGNDYDYKEAPADEEPADYDYNVAPEAEEPGDGYLAPEATAEAAAGSDEAAPEDLDTEYLAPAQSEGRRARNNRPATRQIAEKLVSNARQLVKNGPNADELRRLSPRTNNRNIVGRRSRNNRPHSQSNQQRRQNPKQNSIQRRKKKEISTRRQNGTQKRGQSSKQTRRTNTRHKVDRQVGNSVQCPGGSLDNCIDVCPGSSAKVYVACITGCSSRCEPTANPRRRAK